MPFATTIYRVLIKAKALIKVDETIKSKPKKSLRKAFKRATTFKKASFKTSTSLTATIAIPTVPAAVSSGNEAGLIQSASTLECLADLAFSVNERFGTTAMGFTPAGYDSVVIEVHTVASSPASSIKDFAIEEEEEEQSEDDSDDETVYDSAEDDCASSDTLSVIMEEDEDEEEPVREFQTKQVEEVQVQPSMESESKAIIYGEFEDLSVTSMSLARILHARECAQYTSVTRVKTQADRDAHAQKLTTPYIGSHRSILKGLGRGSPLRECAVFVPEVEVEAPVVIAAAAPPKMLWSEMDEEDDSLPSLDDW